jgi:hypothetical protein
MASLDPKASNNGGFNTNCSVFVCQIVPRVLSDGSYLKIFYESYSEHI